MLAADAHNLTAGKDKLESGDMIGGDAVSERVRAASVFGNVAADGAGFPTGRIGSEVQAVRLGGEREVMIHHAGLNYGAMILGVNFENAIHARENHHHAAGAGERAAGKARTGAPADNGQIVFGGELDDAGDVFRGGWENDHVGTALFDGAVIFIEEKIFRLIKNRG